MASNFKIKGKVQAIDSVGRWADAVVEQIDDQDYTVSFPGWSNFDHALKNIKTRFELILILIKYD